MSTKSIGIGALCAFVSLGMNAEEKPNVLFIICDDLNDYVGVFGGHPDVQTPNIDRLGLSGTMFMNGHTNVPLSCPSRNSLFTGVYPHVSRDFGWTDYSQLEGTRECKTFVEMFHENGYKTLGTGKLLHQEKKGFWDEWGTDRRFNYGPSAFDGTKPIGHPSVHKPFRDVNNVDGSFGSLADTPTWKDENGNTVTGGWTYGAKVPFRYVNDEDRDLMPDELHAKWAVEKIREMDESGTDQPFFLGVGFVKPHTPMYAPQKYFDMYPLDKINLPVRLQDDMADCFYKTVYDMESTMGLSYYDALMKSYEGEEGLKLFLQAYLACVSFVDDQVGAVVDALDNSRFKDNTIVVFVSDHGWQIGEKEYLYKNSIWEESTRIPYIIRHPQLSKPGSQVMSPVSLIDLYPTLMDLCGLEGSTKKSAKANPLDGKSLRPYLENPALECGEYEGALTLAGVGIHTPIEGIGECANPNALWHIRILKPLGKEYVNQQNYSLRTRDYRYIRYHNGKEELYDHRQDPFEWYNLADRKEYSRVLSGLRKQMTKMLDR